MFVGSTHTATVLMLQRHVATFFPKSTRAEVLCQGHQPKTKTLRGSTVFSSECSITADKFFYQGSHHGALSIKSPEFLGQTQAAPNNLSFLTIPEGYKFQRHKGVVLIQDPDPVMLFFTPKTRLIIILCTVGLVGVGILLLVGYCVRKTVVRKRNVVSRMANTVLMDELKETEELSDTGNSEPVAVKIRHCSAS